MNLIHRSIWNDQTGTFVAVSENTRSAGKKISSCTSAAGGSASFSLKILAVSLVMACGAGVQAQPVGGVVSAGSASIGGTAGHMTITQTTPNVAINWQSFGIQAGQSVQFVQPSSSSVALNRVIGADPSIILGSLTANGKVFLVNPNGILFGQGASVNVGGLVASTLAISDANFMARNYQFSGAGAGAVVNQGTINAADGGYVALLGANVSNQGIIAAQLGTVALAAGNAVTLDVAGDKLLRVTVDQGAVNALVDNGGVIRADGGQVLMTTQAAGSLLSNAVNNTGVVQAQTLQNVNGTIMLMGGMANGTVNVAGTLDASAPAGGNGGFIETSAASVKIASGVKVTTEAAQGKTGTWLIDPQDFTIGSLSTDNISGTTLSALLVTNSVTISTATGNDVMVAGTPPVTSLYTATPGNGDIHVNDAIAWSASSNPTTLTLLAKGNVNINKPITATNGNLAVCCGRDVNVKLGADITTTNGSVLLSAGNDINLIGALSTTNGNVTMCAANDVNIQGKITLTHTTSIIPGQSLGLPLGLVLSAGYGASAPGAGGTVVFAPLAPAATVTNAPTTIYYNPVAYTTPTDYSGNIIGAAPIQHMLVFAQGQDKIADGTTTATVASLKGSPVGDVTLVAGPGSTANFATPDVGVNKTITLTGYSLGGADANRYALAVPCCGPVVSTTTANITAVVPPVVVPPVVPPVVVPPVVVPPVVPPVVPIKENTPRPLPPVLTPSTPPAVVPPGYVFTVLPPASVQPPVLVVVTPPAPPVVAPVVVSVPPPPEQYEAPVRKPKPERN
ncbi:filamentous hemagglutinin N-terminal domain-containing protein [Polaromonas sp. CG_9.11]|uniref:two-partner secretion domain-containing protein n=1 Tax=Polaromonas sp. CG_9.11 TaxID=2787730 RepID=UPI0018C960AC|nr:filamentous hemagglutinin N-terminal domain-containing protein [Polaromonas sp. CG_9.11]MBG6076720.1 filamentous hemagglutinin family protein [Polaromonas sp. CG_9.11]